MPTSPSVPSVEPDARSGPDLITLGEAMVLMLADSGLPLASAGHFMRSIAGAESNVAIGVRRLGLRSGWISRVGRDAFGEVVLRSMRAEGVELSVRTDPARPTGLLVRDMPAIGPVHVQYYRAGSAASALSQDDIDPDLVRSSRLLHLTGITAMLSDSAHAAVIAAHSLARTAGRFISFDPNVRLTLGSMEKWADRVAPLARASDIVLAGVDEMPAIAAGATDPIETLLAAGVGVVVVKDGARGSSAHTSQRVVRMPARPVHAVDPVGAGDAFAAGFLARILRDHPDLGAGDVPDAPALERALQAGSLVAAAVVGLPTDIDGLPFAADLDALTGDSGRDVQR